MRKSVRMGGLARLTLPCVLVFGAYGAQQYSVTDLGTLSGNSVSQAYALNNAGEGAGSSSSPTAAIAALFSGGKASSLNKIAANVSVATAINESGEMADYNILDNNLNSVFEAFVYSSGSMKNINSPSLFPGGTEASGINNSGQVVGTGYLSASSFHAFLYSGGKMTDIGPAGSYQASAVTSITRARSLAVIT
jgi:probable HAF family extracellular repeat protein